MEIESKPNNQTRYISIDVGRIIFQKDGFAVIEGSTSFPFEPPVTVFSVRGLRETIPSGRIRVKGRLVEHEKYGLEFQCWFCKPKTLVVSPEHQALINDLVGGKVPGIGPETGKRVIELVGNDFQAVISNPESLTGIAGIGKKKAEMIAAMLERLLNHANARTK